MSGETIMKTVFWIFKRLAVGVLAILIFWVVSHAWGAAWQHVVPQLSVKDAGIFGLAAIILPIGMIFLGVFIFDVLTEARDRRAEEKDDGRSD